MGADLKRTPLVSLALTPPPAGKGRRASELRKVISEHKRIMSLHRQVHELQRHKRCTRAVSCFSHKRESGALTPITVQMDLFRIAGCSAGSRESEKRMSHTSSSRGSSRYLVAKRAHPSGGPPSAGHPSLDHTSCCPSSMTLAKWAMKLEWTTPGTGPYGALAPPAAQPAHVPGPSCSRGTSGSRGRSTTCPRTSPGSGHYRSGSRPSCRPKAGQAGGPGCLPRH